MCRHIALQLAMFCSVASGGEIIFAEAATTPLPGGALAKFGDGANLGKLALSTDGRFAAVAGRDGKVLIFDASARKQAREIQAHDEVCHDVAFSLDGASLFSCGESASVRQWDVATGNEIRKFDGHQGEVRAVVCSPDGRRMASTDHAGIRLWDIASGRQMRLMTSHKVPAGVENIIDISLNIDAVRFSADGRVLLSEANDESARLWDVLTGAELRMLPNHDGTTAALALSPDGQWGASTRGEGRLRVWDVAAGEMRAILSGHTDDITCVAFSPDSRYILSGAGDETLRQWEVDSGAEIRRFKLNSIPVSALFSPDGKFAYTTSAAEGIVVWDMLAAPVHSGTDAIENFDQAWLALSSKEYTQRAAAMNWYLKSRDAAAAVADLRSRHKDAGANRPQSFGALIERLDDGLFPVRTAAFKDLQSAGAQARHDLLQALRHPSTEARHSAAALLAELGTTNDIRPVLAVEILASLNTPEAREELRRLGASSLPCAAHAAALSARLGRK